MRMCTNTYGARIQANVCAPCMCASSLTGTRLLIIHNCLDAAASASHGAHTTIRMEEHAPCMHCITPASASAAAAECRRVCVCVCAYILLSCIMDSGCGRRRAKRAKAHTRMQPTIIQNDLMKLYGPRVIEKCCCPEPAPVCVHACRR